MIIKEDEYDEAYLAHYGVLRKSGRYPWGSGGTQAARNKMFLDSVAELRKKGMSETEIARGFGITTTQLRAANSIARNEKKQADISQAQRLHNKGWSNVAIGERMGINESSVRHLLAPGQKDRADVLQTTSNMLKDQVDKKGYIDIGQGVENHVGVSQTKLNTAVAVLVEQGYTVHRVKVEQLGTGHQTELKVLAPPGTTQKEVWENRSQIKQITDFSEDGGRSFLGLQKPLSVDPKRVSVRYKEDGGDTADGVIYVRPGVPDVSLGGARYAQVRIAVGNSHYLKGMAMYKDDLPAGVDLQFNTNKAKADLGPDKMAALKKMKDDPDNPFGAVVRQRIDPATKKVVSAMNIVNEEGNWQDWSRSLSSQMLSKQSPTLAKTQLDMTYERKKNDLEAIKALTNPAVRKKLLESYADDVDSSAVHLKAYALPRQGNHVILPINSMKETEIYAPNYRNGERVALIRYPHGGIFEIPELTVNNNHPAARRALGNALDAVGINSKVAERLSGADFDGDTVLVIPNNSGRVKTAPALAGLKNFDPQRDYPAYDGMRTMDGGTWNAKTRKVEFAEGKKPSPRTKQVEMGVVSNLITDMTIRGATSSELARAVRHSMVVIDAEKHSLNYKLSAEVNGIAALKAKYQGGSRAGASTLISRASAEVRVPERRPRSAAKGGAVDKETGRKVFEETGATYTNRKGQTVPRTEKSKRLAEEVDANRLSSGTAIEKAYATHSNRLKALANEARRSAVNTKGTPYSPSAKKVYAKEVASLDKKLDVALRNSPLERQAQLLANTVVQSKRQANPNMDAAELKKVKSQALTEARLRTGARKIQIDLTDSEWAAIQAGAISNHKLSQILNNADLDRIKKLATPKAALKMTSTKQRRAEAMLNAGYTQAEVADALGVSLTTLKTSIGQ